MIAGRLRTRRLEGRRLRAERRGRKIKGAGRGGAPDGKYGVHECTNTSYILRKGDRRPQNVCRFTLEWKRKEKREGPQINIHRHTLNFNSKMIPTNSELTSHTDPADPNPLEEAAPGNYEEPGVQPNAAAHYTSAFNTDATTLVQEYKQLPNAQNFYNMPHPQSLPALHMCNVPPVLMYPHGPVNPGISMHPFAVNPEVADQVERQVLETRLATIYNRAAWRHQRGIENYYGGFAPDSPLPPL